MARALKGLGELTTVDAVSATKKSFYAATVQMLIEEDTIIPGRFELCFGDRLYPIEVSRLADDYKPFAALVFFYREDPMPSEAWNAWFGQGEEDEEELSLNQQKLKWEWVPKRQQGWGSARDNSVKARAAFGEGTSPGEVEQRAEREAAEVTFEPTPRPTPQQALVDQEPMVQPNPNPDPVAVVQPNPGPVAVQPALGSLIGVQTQEEHGSASQSVTHRPGKEPLMEEPEADSDDEAMPVVNEEVLMRRLMETRGPRIGESAGVLSTGQPLGASGKAALWGQIRLIPASALSRRFVVRSVRCA